MGPLGGGSHVSTAGGSLLAVILRFDGEFDAPSVDKAITTICYGYTSLPAIVMVSECIVVVGDRSPTTAV